jgi:hypothetical protein
MVDLPPVGAPLSRATKQSTGFQLMAPPHRSRQGGTAFEAGADGNLSKHTGASGPAPSIDLVRHSNLTPSRGSVEAEQQHVEVGLSVNSADGKPDFGPRISEMQD